MKDETALAQQDQGQPPMRTMLESVMRAISQPGMTPEVARQYLELGKELEAIAAKKLYAAAIAELQPNLPVIKKNGLIVYKEGTAGKQFAKWDDVYRSCMPELAKHGLTCSFSSDLLNGNALKVSMTVKHVGGHQEESSLVVPWLDTGGSKSPAQAAASSFTLAQRHLFVKYFNVLTENQDDDGSGKGVAERVTEQQVETIDNVIRACSDKEPGFGTRFAKWLKSEFRVDKPSELFQGTQLESVMGKLKEKQRGLSI